MSPAPVRQIHVKVRCSKCGRKVHCRLMINRGYQLTRGGAVLDPPRRAYELLCHRCRSRYRGRYVYPTEQQFLTWFVDKSNL